MTCHSILSAVALLALGVTPGSGGVATKTSAAESLSRYLQRNQVSCRESGQRMEVEIEASLPKLEKRGTMKGLKVTSGTGQVAYRLLQFTGDTMVKNEVIVRYLTSDAHPPEQLGDVGTTLKNYKFHYSRTVEYRGATAYVFQVRPRQKRIGLYKGELWLDAASGEPILEAGELVKSPSFFIRGIRFVRNYSQNNPQFASCGPPERMSINVQTRIVGDANLVVRQHPAVDALAESAGVDDADTGIANPAN
jgi:hypothetical protein